MYIFSCLHLGFSSLSTRAILLCWACTFINFWLSFFVLFGLLALLVHGSGYSALVVSFLLDVFHDFIILFFDRTESLIRIAYVSSSESGRA